MPTTEESNQGMQDSLHDKKVKNATKPEEIQRIVSKYSIDSNKLLGKGMEGEVYAATDRTKKTAVAVKFVKKYYPSEDVDGKKVPKEYEMLMRGQDAPNVVQLLDYYQNAEHSVYYMETFQNCSNIHRYINDENSGGSLSAPLAIEVFRRMTDTAIQLLERGIYHHDLTAKNVIIDLDSIDPKDPKSLRMRVIDFDRCTNFVKGELCTHVYLCPAQYALEEMIDNRWYSPESATVFCLAVVAYLMLCGEMPFDHWSDLEMQQTSIDELNGLTQISDSTKKLILECLERKETETKHTLADILTVLQSDVSTS